MRAGSGVCDDVRPVDLLELVVVPACALGALVLRIEDLDGRAPQRLLDRAGIEVQLDELPVRLVLVVEVVEDVVEPVLERQPSGIARLLRDVRVHRVRRPGTDALEPVLVTARAGDRVPRQIDVVLERAVVEVGRGRCAADPAVPPVGTVEERHVGSTEDDVDEHRPVRLTRSADPSLLLEGDHRAVAIRELLLARDGRLRIDARSCGRDDGHRDDRAAQRGDDRPTLTAARVTLTR